MFESCETVQLQKQEVKCYDLTYGFLIALGDNLIEETKHGVVIDGSDLSEEEVMSLRGSEVDKLYNVILKLTYPRLYDSEGNLKEQDLSEEESEDKKKL